MALTNKGLKEILSAAGVDAEHMESAVTAIMSGHNTTKNAIIEERDTAIRERDDARKERDTYKADAEKLTEVQKELETVKGGDWENKYNTLLAEIAAKESRAAKEQAVTAYYAAKGITGDAAKIAMQGSSAAIDALELKKDGSIKDASALDALVSGVFAPLVAKTTVIPADSPPDTGGIPAAQGGMTRESILAIKDDAEMIRAIEANPAAFGLA